MARSLSRFESAVQSRATSLGIWREGLGRHGFELRDVGEGEQCRLVIYAGPMPALSWVQAAVCVIGHAKGRIHGRSWAEYMVRCRDGAFVESDRLQANGDPFGLMVAAFLAGPDVCAEHESAALDLLGRITGR